MIDDQDTIDLLGVRKGGGADVVILVREKLSGDPQTQGSLLDKIERYFEFVNSDDFKKQCGSPSPKNTCVVVKCHVEPDPVIRELVAKSRGWAEDNQCDLRIVVSEKSGSAPLPCD